MLRLRRWMILLCCLPGLVSAADDAAPVCGGPAAAPEAFAPAEGRPLTHDERVALGRLFRGLDGEWRGTLVEQVCMLNGNVQTRHYQAKLKLAGSSDQLRLVGDYLQQRSRTTRRFARKLLLTGDGLRVDHLSRVGEVTLRSADATGLAYLQRYRTRHSLAAAPKPRPGGADQGQAQGRIPDQTRDAQASQTAGAGDTGETAVAGSDNLVSGEANPQPAPEPERRSLVREERFRLQARGSRGLELVQDYYTQGVYSGTMRWQLQRY